jgi:large subunit ribosomal protein L15
MEGEPMSLHQLKAPRGANRERKRVGRGQASGLGKTAGRGGKGQKARTGNMHFEGFEGGQMPLQRRLPKFGFVNAFRRELEEVQVGSLSKLPAGPVDLAALKQVGLVRGNRDGLVVLGKGELAAAYVVRAERVTAGARAAIEKAGGSVEILPRPQTMGEKARAEKAARAPRKPASEQAKPAAEKAEKKPAAAKAEKKAAAEKAEKKAAAEKAERKPASDEGEEKPGAEKAEKAK